MSDPRDRAAATAPATLGEGCLRRFDPDAMDETLGAEFSEAASLWAQWQQSVDGEQHHRSQDVASPPALG